MCAYGFVHSKGNALRWARRVVHFAGQPIELTGNAKYITMFDGTGLANGCKMAGVLPRSALLPFPGPAPCAEDDLPHDTLVFFGAASPTDVQARLERVRAVRAGSA
jgi:hypothetical protein